MPRKLLTTLLTLICGCCFVTSLIGCSNDTDSDAITAAQEERQSSTQTEQCREKLSSAISTLRPLAFLDLTRPEVAAGSLNRWLADCARARTDELTLSEATAAMLSPTVVRQATASRFSRSDAEYIRDCMLLRRMTQLIEESQDDERARALEVLNYAARNLSLNTPDERRIPMSLYDTLVLGRGSTEDRVWLMGEMLRQMQLDGVLLLPSDPDQAAAALLVAVPLENSILLYDPFRAVEVVPAAKADAARASAVDWLMTQPGWESASVRLVARANAFAPRMLALEEQLPADDAAVLFEELAGGTSEVFPLLERVQEASGGRWTGDSVSLWNYPDAQSTAANSLNEADSKTYAAMMNKFNAPYRRDEMPSLEDMIPPGELPDTEAERRLYIARRGEEILAARLKQMEESTTLLYGVPSRGLLKTRIRQLMGNTDNTVIQQYQQVRLQTKDDTLLIPVPQVMSANGYREYPLPESVRKTHSAATGSAMYWTGVTQFEAGNYGSAATTLYAYRRQYPDDDWMYPSIRLQSQALQRMNSNQDIGELLRQADVEDNPEREMVRAMLAAGGFAAGDTQDPSTPPDASDDAAPKPDTPKPAADPDAPSDPGADAGSRPRPANTFDVVIYGGTSAGLAAAIQADRMGATVVILEPGQHIGGLTSGGLGWTDSGRKEAVGGISREFYQRIKQHYDDEASWTLVERDAYDRYRPDDDAMWTFEPKVAEATYRSMLSETSAVLIESQRLDRSDGVVVEDDRIKSIRMESGDIFTGRMFIDATYEGDLMAAAGVTYTVGREPNSEYDETLNGVQKRLNTHSHRFVKEVDPYVTPGDPSSGLLPEISADPPGEDGTGDDRVQAYCFRMCMSNVPENSVPFPKPDGYDELRYELLLRNFEAGDLRFPMKPDMMPNGKTDTNNNCAFSTDYLGGNYDYPDADYARREEIIADHENYQKGLMWTLANHPRVPEEIRNRMSAWGLAKDEFTDNGNWPHQLYIREARRMVSDYVTTEQDCRRLRVAEDSVGLGSYNMDSHNVQRYVTPEGFAQNEGDVQESPRGPYVVSYRSIVPAQNEEVKNLAVPVCLSATHIAYGSVRMEPVFMILGQSAATACVLALNDDSALQDLPYDTLRERLLQDGQVLDLPEDAVPDRRSRSTELPGIVQDDDAATLEGAWVSSSSTSPYIDFGYRHDGDDGKGEKTATFQLTAPLAGTYVLRMSYSAHDNRATNVPVTIQAGDVSETRTVNQKQPPEINATWHELTRLELAADTTVTVTISNAETDGHVIVDAVQLEAVTK